MISDDDRLAADLVAEAGRRLLALRAAGGAADELRRAGDRSSHEFLAAELARQRPGDAVLSTADPVKTPASPPGTLRLLVSRTRPPEFMTRLARELGAELVPLGSAGAKAAAVICGDAEAYVHSGGQYEWDSAAPVAVAVASGLHASRIDGSKLSYNQAKPSLPDILICQAALADPLLEAISSVR